MNVVAIAVVLLYFAFLLGLGLLARRYGGKKRGGEEYFVAGRSFKPILLFFTMAATNFSAFFFLGFSDAAYRYGFGEYGVMALGTALMPIMFYIIGRKVWQLGKEKGYTTAPELIGGEAGSRKLQWLTMFVMILFTLPYLAVQASGAGYILQSLVGIDPAAGAVTVVIVIAAYVSLGGMRGSGWTDVVQGVLMFTAMLLVGLFISSALGGFAAAGERAFAADPGLFSRAGGFFSPGIWLSFMILWIFVDPMFPQLFTRFYTAKSEKSLRTSMVIYPFLISFLFLIPVLVGVWAHGAGVEAGTNTVMLLMVERYTPDWVYYLVMVGALSALMSTADSQLFAISTMAVKDIGSHKKTNEVRRSIAITWILAAGSILYIFYFFRSGQGIMLFLIGAAFSGLVVLAPSFLGALYLKRMRSISAIISILAGEAYVFLASAGFVPSFGLLVGVVGFIIAGGVLAGAEVVLQRRENRRFLPPDQ